MNNSQLRNWWDTFCLCCHVDWLILKVVAAKLFKLRLRRHKKVEIGVRFFKFFSCYRTITYDWRKFSSVIWSMRFGNSVASKYLLKLNYFFGQYFVKKKDLRVYFFSIFLRLYFVKSAFHFCHLQINLSLPIKQVFKTSMQVCWIQSPTFQIA